MHQTTLRFGADLWEQIEREAAAVGVSTAQFVREAALARVAYTAGRRGDAEYDAALVHASTSLAARATRQKPATVERSARESDSSVALWSSQAAQPRRRSQAVRERAATIRATRSDR
jgi:hypothetical protein